MHDPERTDRVMLLRSRVSRIFFLRKFFDYPISMKKETFFNMGFARTVRAGVGYLWSCVHKLPETSLENFYINRFGRPLYEMFFEGYTEKVWGVHPSKLGADWGSQRVKGLSVISVLKDMLRRALGIRSKHVETSLIEQFIYPKYGPGQLWETVAEDIRKQGGEILMQHEVTGVNVEGGKVVSVVARTADGEEKTFPCDYFLSTMPVKDLVPAIHGISVPDCVKDIAANLPYRDFITVGLCVKKMRIKNQTAIPTFDHRVPDTWIYIQERDVHIGRLQVFNNWSPYLVNDYEHTMWIGLEYFCTEGDRFWTMPKEQFIEMAIDEMVKIDIIDREDVLDACHVRVKKACPAYYGSYYQLDEVKSFLDTLPNLYCLGRNGQHRYNNMDHSMLTAFECVRNIKDGVTDKTNIWNVNTEKEYHESKLQKKGITKANKVLRDIVFPAVIVVAWLLLALYTFNSKPDLNGDNFCYYIYATSLAEGHGYCDLSSPGSPATSSFPPGYPLLMMPLRMITDSVVAQKWLNEVFVLVSILLLYFALLALSLPKDISFVAAVAGLFCPRLLHFSTMMMSESSFLVMSMLVFFALIRLNKHEGRWWSELRSPWFYVMLVAMALAYHIRTQGVALVAAVLFVFLVRRRWASLAGTVVGFTIGCLPWIFRNHVLGLGGNRYLGAIMVANPWRPEMGQIGFGEVVSRFFDTLRMLVFNAIPSTVLPFAPLNCDEPTYTWYIYLLGALMVAVLLLGAWRLGKQRWFAIGYIAATLGVISIFSTPSGNRYLTSILPFLTAFLLIGLWSVFTWLLQRRWKRRTFPACILLLLLFLFKSGLQEEHRLAQEEYPLPYRQFIQIGKAAQDKFPSSTIVCSRKPQIFYLYSHCAGCTYSFTTDARELIAGLVRNRVDAVLVDALGYSSTYRYLIPAIQQYPQFFPRVLVRYDDTGTYLFTFDRERAKAELQL